MSEKLFNVGVKGIIIRDDKVLLLKALRDHDSWEFPGGRISAEETVEQTINRELKEELPNINHIKIGNILGAHRIHKDIKENIGLVLLFYRIEAVFNGEIEISHEHLGYKWVTAEEATELGGKEVGKLAFSALAELREIKRLLRDPDDA